MKKYTELNNQVIAGGSIDLSKDQEALTVFFKEEVNAKTHFFHDLEEKISYMLDNEYWDVDVITLYSTQDIKRVFKRAYSFKFRFKSFMGASKFYNSYAIKRRDGEGWLERYEDRMSIVALTLANGDVDLALSMVEHLVLQRYTPATPTLMNAGRARSGRLTSCFLLDDCSDNLTSITKTLSFAAELSKGGGGIGINLSSLRASGEPLRGHSNATKGVMGVAKMVDNILRYADQAGQRPGAGAVYLSVMHPDFTDLLNAKKISADEDARLKTLSVGAVIPDVFMRKVKAGEDIYQFYPHSVFKETGLEFSDIDWDKEYERLAENSNVRKKRVSARRLFEDIAVTQGESGYPYLLFEGNANRVNPVSNVGKIRMSNLCSEILQPTQPSEYNTYGLEDQDIIGLDVSCNLASIVVSDDTLANLPEVVESAIRGLDFVARSTDVHEVPAVQRANREMRSLGLGVMGLHSYLAQKGIRYESPEAAEFTAALFSAVHYWARVTSNTIAAEEGFSFAGFDGSSYQDGSYFGHYLENDYKPKSEAVAKLFPEGVLPTQESWEMLIDDIAQYGLAHSHVMAVAPTGNISYVANASQGIMPITERIEIRTTNKFKTVYPMPGLETSMWTYTEAYDMDMKHVIDIASAAQPHVDQGISCTLFIKDTATTRDLQRYYAYAYSKGLKTLYYTRTRKAAIDECVACAV